MSCMIVTVIKTTLAACDFTKCNQFCMNYLLQVSTQCPRIFNNQEYLNVWNSIFDICARQGIEAVEAVPMISH